MLHKIILFSFFFFFFFFFFDLVVQLFLSSTAVINYCQYTLCLYTHIQSALYISIPIKPDLPVPFIFTILLILKTITANWQNFFRLDINFYPTTSLCNVRNSFFLLEYHFKRHKYHPFNILYKDRGI